MAEDDRASNSWSDLPWDLLDRILQHLELPESLAVAAVCAPWRSAAVASGVPPRSRTPWLVSRVQKTSSSSSTIRNLLNAGNTDYKVSLPQGRRHLVWCGASHDWLVASDELSSLLLCKPFTRAVIPLPPITALGCVKGVYDDDGCIVGYQYRNSDVIRCADLGRWFYLKVVLSCNPSHGDYIAMAICGNNEVAFARAGESTWRLVSEMPWQNKKRTFSERRMDLYADCVYHDGKFYTVTMCGAVEAWDLNTEGPAQEEPSREAIIAAGDRRYWRVLTRFLVSTPWGALLEIRTQRRRDNRGKIEVDVLQVDVEERRLVRLSPATALQDQAVFVGLNESWCLHPTEFPELRPNCIYFTTPWLTTEECFGLDDWSGVVIYDLESQTSDHVLPKSDHYSILCPRHVWLVPNI